MNTIIAGAVTSTDIIVLDILAPVSFWSFVITCIIVIYLIMEGKL